VAFFQILSKPSFVCHPTTERRVVYRRSVVRFLCAEGHSAKNIHKEIFSIYGGKCLSREAQFGRKRFTDYKHIEAEVLEWLRQQSKGFYAVGFDALVKR
jgi:hypothetical protein